MAQANEQKQQGRQSGQQASGALARRSESRPFSAHPLVRQMQQDLDELIDAFGMNRWGLFGGTRAARWLPQVDIEESDGRLLVKADLPGLERKDVNVEVTEDALVISGERRHEHSEDHRGVQRCERSWGSFSRMVPLPEGADVDRAEANFRNGVLEISIPIDQSKEARSRKIEINETPGGAVH